MKPHSRTEKFLGTCRLTGRPGQFVKSHLIPQALTQPAQKGMPFYQLGPGSKPVRRWSSWYDPKLVTQAGEDLLTSFDTWAIEELRKHKLVWSGWGRQRSLGSLHSQIGPSPWGIRKIEGVDPAKLRLFFLSILWRAAATELPEFDEVELAGEDLATLGRMLREHDPYPVSFYPVQLTQLSTLGQIHNHSPIADIKRVPRLDTSSAPPEEVPIFRFYFDGLVVHFDRRLQPADAVQALGNLVVGAEDTLLVTTQTYEDSYQRLHVECIQQHTKSV